jgi:8-hydroxy-5-deazaflavin:NADPH oxidoreductase
MKLAVIGSGKIGKSIGAWASRVGYEVIFSSRNLEHAKDAARNAGKNSQAASIPEAVAQADLVLLSVPYNTVKDVLSGIGSLANGKTLIDVTNALSSDFTSLAVGFTTSGAEEIQKLVPGAKVVKAFNTIFAQVYASQNPEIKGSKISVFYAGDDNDSKSRVADLIAKMGFDAVDSGPLKSARVLEPFALLNINLGYSLGHGTLIGFSFLR